ncbi:unnamed protein product [Closterium sp. Naga37s-1]|nr:unnamed protein product [Closterium sp. Naga37s-1]
MAPIAGNGASGSPSLYKVWEIRALKRQKRSDEARSLLERVAKQVEPIMVRRRWKVPLLSEFSPSNARLLGLNINRGREIRVRLRPAGKPDSFFPYEHVLGTMLHELTHIERGPHDAKFYKLLDELNEECDELIARGITGTPFGGSGHRLGSSAYPSIRPVRLGTSATSAAAAAAAGSSSFGVLSTATPPRGVAGASSAQFAADVASRKAAAASAERRRQQQRIMMPAGGRRLGGDSEIMKVLSPVQAAAMAAERRMRDDAWAGGTRKRPSDSLEQSSRRRKVTAGGAAVGSAAGGENSEHSTRVSSGVREEDAAGGEQRADRADTWACPVCTLINRGIVLQCEACFAVRPSSRPAFGGASVTVAAGTSANVNAKAEMVIGGPCGVDLLAVHCSLN